MLCDDWFGVKASVFKLNLLCPTCEKRLEKECRVCNGLGDIVSNESIEECPECEGTGIKRDFEIQKCNSCKLELTPNCPIRTGSGCDLYEKKGG